MYIYCSKHFKFYTLLKLTSSTRLDSGEQNHPGFEDGAIQQNAVEIDKLD